MTLTVTPCGASYIEAMKDMIRLYGPYDVVASGAALLHAGPEMGGKRLSMSLVRRHTPVPFGHPEHDPVDIALAFSSIDHVTHIRAVGEAIALLGKAQAMGAIRQARTPQAVLAIIGGSVQQGGARSGERPAKREA